MLFTDASDAPQRLGAEDSAIYDDLKWALEVKRALDNGLNVTVRELQFHRHEIEELPSTGAPGELRKELGDELANLSERLRKEDFFKHGADLNSLLTHIKGRVRDTVISLSDQQNLRLKEGVEDLRRLPEWVGLTQEERGNTVAQLEALALTVSEDLAGLKKLLAQDYDISSTIDELRRSIARQTQERIRQERDEEAAKFKGNKDEKSSRSFSIPAKISSTGELDALILQLNELKAQLALYDEFDLSFVVSHEN